MSKIAKRPTMMQADPPTKWPEKLTPRVSTAILAIVFMGR